MILNAKELDNIKSRLTWYDGFLKTYGRPESADHKDMKDLYETLMHYKERVEGRTK